MSTTNKERFTKVHGCKSNGEAASIIAAASASISQLRTATHDADSIRETMAKMEKDVREKFLRAVNLNTSPDDARLKAWEAVQRLQLAAMKRIMKYDVDFFTSADADKLQEALQYATELNAKYPLPTLEGEKRA